MPYLKVALCLCLALLAGPTWASAPEWLAQVTVERPGVVLFNADARRQALAAAPADLVQAWCGARESGWPEHGVVRTVRNPEGYGADQRAEPFLWTLMTGTAAAFALDDAGARAAVLDNLTRWAAGGALMDLKGYESSHYYAMNRALLPIIVAYSLLRDHPDLSPEQRTVVDAWLHEVVELRGVERQVLPPDTISENNNHSYLRASVTTAYGALIGDERRFRYGIDVYLEALDQMRADGSLPLETARGARALWYQRQALASLVAIAEIAAMQGFDLYSVAGEQGATLHDAVAFLAKGIDEPQLVWDYAEENLNPGPYKNYMVQDLGFMEPRGHGRHYMAWIEPYAARFPDLPQAQRLHAELAAFTPDYRPMIDEFSGGNTTCFFAPTG